MNGGSGIWREFLRRLLRNRLAAAGGAIIAFFLLVSAFPFLFSSNPRTGSTS